MAIFSKITLLGSTAKPVSVIASLAIILLMTSSSNLAWSETNKAGRNWDGKSDPTAAIEDDWKLPASAVGTDDLLPFYVSEITKQQFFVDANSIETGNDGIVRYTMVSVSASGAKNISFEGIRCISFEKRIYAIGHADGTWAKTRNNDWTMIANKGANLQQAALADYVCTDAQITGTPKQIIEKIRYHSSTNGQK